MHCIASLRDFQGLNPLQPIISVSESYLIGVILLISHLMIIQGKHGIINKSQENR